MQCQLCKSDINLVVDPFAGLASLICDCRTVQMSTLGVIEHGRSKQLSDSAPRAEADTSGSREAARRDDSSAKPERASETATKTTKKVKGTADQEDKDGS